MQYTIITPDESHVDTIQRMILSDPKYLLPRTREDIVALLDTFFVALDERGVPIGCACLEIYSPRIAELRSLYVNPEFRSNGIGTALINSVKKLHAERGIKELLTITHQGAVDTLDNCGFKPALPGEKIALFYRG